MGRATAQLVAARAPRRRRNVRNALTVADCQGERAGARYVPAVCPGGRSGLLDDARAGHSDRHGEDAAADAARQIQGIRRRARHDPKGGGRAHAHAGCGRHRRWLLHVRHHRLPRVRALEEVLLRARRRAGGTPVPRAARTRRRSARHRRRLLRAHAVRGRAHTDGGASGVRAERHRRALSLRGRGRRRVALQRAAPAHGAAGVVRHGQVPHL
mmetsp:Transcript_38910/g.85532  ORF Transcript_38910/g.85532 Transcript_38910/m.85532 type:complete len:213 (-) Transcript_38910:598-1236(-)